MGIAIASGHAGSGLKETVREYLGRLGHMARDLKTRNAGPVDDLDFAEPLAGVRLAGALDLAVLICGSGSCASVALISLCAFAPIFVTTCSPYARDVWAGLAKLHAAVQQAIA